MAQRTDSWDGWKLAWQHGFVAVGLALVLGTALPGSGASTGGIAARAGVVAALGAWYGLWFVRPRAPATPHLPYLAGAAVLWAAASALDPALLPLGAAVLIPYCLRSLAWTVAVVAAWSVVLLAQRFAVGGTLTWPPIACFLGVAAAVVALGFVATLDREGRKRQQLLDQLAASQAELVAAERAAGTLAERQRLARDIHDTLTQGFASIAMLLDAAQAAMDREHPATGSITQALATARQNLVDSRSVLWALQPERPEQPHLADAARELTDRLAEQTELTASTTVAGDPIRLPAPIEASVLRIIQEALTNVRKHARASQVQVTLSYMDDLLAVDIQDDGGGFINATAPDGYGLRSMRDRVAELGGILTIESSPGHGCTIAAEIPSAARTTAHLRAV